MTSMKFKNVRILFFVDGSAPTQDDILAAAELNAQVMFRNARAVPAEGSLEDCDGVAGKVPPRYAKAFPTAEKAIGKRKTELKAMSDKVGDSPAPVTPEQPQKGAGAKPSPAAADAPSAPSVDGAGDAPAVDADNAKAPGVEAVAPAAWKSNS